MPQEIQFKVENLERIVPNPFNPNKMEKKFFDLLKKSINRLGMVDPILVRPHPIDEGYFEIVDGEHRYLACKELGLKEVPIVLIDIDDTETALSTITLNRIRGRFDREKLGPLLAQLAEELGSELDKLTGWSDMEIHSWIDLELDEDFEPLSAYLKRQYGVSSISELGEKRYTYLEKPEPKEVSSIPLEKAKVLFSVTLTFRENEFVLETLSVLHHRPGKALVELCRLARDVLPQFQNL